MSVLQKAALNSLSNTSVSYKGGKLTPEARAKLQKIKEREALKDTLLQKYEAKFGSKKTSQVAPATSQSTASDVEVASVNQLNLVDVDNEGQHDAHDSQSGATSPGSHRRRLRGSSSTPALGEWAKIVEHNRAAAKEYERIQAEIAKKNQETLKRDLEAQLEEQRKQKEAERKQKLEALQQSQSELQKWQDEERRKKEHFFVKSREDKEVRGKQIVEIHKKRQNDRIKEVQEDKAVVDRIQAELNAERLAAKERKQQHLEQMREILADNERQRLIKQKQLEAEREHEVELQKAYIALLDKQEAQRQASFAATYAKQEQSQAVYEQMVGASVAAQAEEDSRRAAQMQEEYNRRRLEKEKADKEAAIQRIESMKQTLQDQIAERDRKKQQEKLAQQQYATEVQAIAERARKEEEERQLRIRQQKLKSKSELDKQIAEIESKRAQEASQMSDIEKKLNAKLLSAITENKIEPPQVVSDKSKTPTFAWKVKPSSPF